MTSDIGVLADIRRGEPAAWLRAQVSGRDGLSVSDYEVQIEEARLRFARFRAPLARLLGGESWDGDIRSDLLDWPSRPGEPRILVKADHALPMTGSIKARGGVHELLKFVEGVALTTALIAPGGDYGVLATPDAARLFADYEVSVASTGNLGFSIGLVARAFGLRATVHMSNEAKQWKKDRLRGVGATVIEHEGDYGEACAAARATCPDDAHHHFVDDESSPDLFYGYAVAAAELALQLRERGLVPSRDRPLVVYLPCGVGGAPGGITCGLKGLFDDSVICVFVEPTLAPCMLVALASGSPADDPPSVYEFGLSNRTVADGLAVAKASSFVLRAVGETIDAAISVSDEAMLETAAAAWTHAHLRLEPSAAASLAAIPMLQATSRPGWPVLTDAIHVAWATGGSMLPDTEWRAQLERVARPAPARPGATPSPS